MHHDRGFFFSSLSIEHQLETPATVKKAVNLNDTQVVAFNYIQVLSEK